MLPVRLTRLVGRKTLILKKESPHIFFVAGVVGSVASTVLACRATLKLSDTLDEIQLEIDQVKEINDVTNKNYDTNSHRADLGYVYGKAGLKLAKLYGPAVLVGTASITALTGSHIQMTRRNASLMAAYALVQQAYDEYRERVREEFGEDRELEIYRGTDKESENKELAELGDPNKRSPYSVIFDEYSKNWEKDPELNRLFVQCQQNYANNLLQARGHLFLNEVYDMLGIDRSKAGAVVGWVIGTDGDNYVDFGIFDAHNSGFVNGWERSIVLDFNVDGVIYDKI